MNLQKLVEQGAQFHQAGRFSEAENLYRQALSWDPNYPDALYLLGILASQAGELDLAADLIGRAATVSPSSALYHGSLGQIRALQGRLDEAVASCRRGLVLDPGLPEVHNNMGSVLLKLGRLDEAAASFRRTIELRSDLPEGHYNLGIALQRLGRVEEAVAEFRHAIRLRPDVPDYYNNLGNALFTSGKPEEAIAAYDRAIVLRPGDPNAYSNLGTVLRDLDRPADAISAFRQALSLQPDHAESMNNLGCLLYEAGQLQEAVDVLHRTLSIRPDYAEARYNLGNALRADDKLDEAIAEFRAALKLRANYADALVGLGNVLGEKAQLEDAIASYRQAIVAAPDHAVAHNNLALSLLQKGDLEEGWREHEWRWRLKANTKLRPNFPQPMWSGEALNGRRILLQAEQGFGDSIQFIRYLPQVQAAGGRVIVQCQHELVRLFESLKNIDQLIPRGQALPEFDVHCPMATLPLVLKTTLETIPRMVPYLVADVSLSEAWRDRLPADRFKVGLVWAGRELPEPRRSIPLEMLKPLLQSAGMAFVSLQIKTAGLRPAPLSAAEEWLDWTDELKDFAHTAALIDNLDLVITVDTAVAHLAGAMGKRVWVLLMHISDWRWMTGRDDSPWYPTMRLFRQPRRGDWAGAIEAVVRELQCLK